MGKFGFITPNVNVPRAPVTTTPAQEREATDDAAARTRTAERRRRGRRASILSGVSDEDIAGALLGRPGATST